MERPSEYQPQLGLSLFTGDSCESEGGGEEGLVLESNVRIFRKILAEPLSTCNLTGTLGDSN